jgi:L,D-transpeptidase catalytic domain
MRGRILPACVFLGTVFAMPKAHATVRINIDLSTQTMHVHSDEGDYDWRISTARDGYRTPHGTYRPHVLLRMHYSHKYHMSPMPYSIFFDGGFAIHGTYETRWLGHPASHGCVRLAPAHAARLFQMVKAEGAEISITGTPPHSYAWLHRRHHPALYARYHAPAYYAWHTNPDGTLSYAPARHWPAPVKSWQVNPVSRSFQSPWWP